MTGAVVTFSRAADTGALTFAGCVSDTGDDGRTGTEGSCTDGDALGRCGRPRRLPGRPFRLRARRPLATALAWLARDPLTGNAHATRVPEVPPRAADRCGSSLRSSSAERDSRSAPTAHTCTSARRRLRRSISFARDAETGAARALAAASATAAPTGAASTPPRSTPSRSWCSRPTGPRCTPRRDRAPARRPARRRHRALAALPPRARSRRATAPCSPPSRAAPAPRCPWRPPPPHWR